MTKSIKIEPPQKHLEKISPNDTLIALRNWHGGGTAQNSLKDLFIYRSIRQKNKISYREANNLLIESALKELSRDDPEAALLLRHRFLDDLPVTDVANSLNIADSTVYIRQKEAITKLTQIIYTMDTSAHEAHADQLLNSLPFPIIAPLIGVEQCIEQITEVVSAAHSPWILSIEGLGGIGKTALAQKIVHRTLRADQSWQKVAWIAAKRDDLNLDCTVSTNKEPVLPSKQFIGELYDQLMPEKQRPANSVLESATEDLEQYISQTKCLIVVDNLGTTEDVQQILPIIERLMNPTKFVLTSRTTYQSISDIFHFQIPELSRADTLLLIRQIALNTNQPQILEATNEELFSIYDAVGGNPLAIKQFVGQLYNHGLNDVLADFKSSEGQTAETLYKYVYWLSWSNLSEHERQLLYNMILVSSQGKTIEELREWTGLAPSEIRNALNILTTLNLVDSKGTLNQRQYSICNLTSLFLHKQALAWQ